jgi:hypothetical protein
VPEGVEMTGKSKKPLTQPAKGDPNYGKFCAQPGSLPVSDLEIQPSLKEQMQGFPETMVKIHCPVCGWEQDTEKSMWEFQSSQNGHGYTCGSGKCPSHTAMVFGPAPFDYKACILCDHVIVQQVLGNKCKLSGALCCNLKECPIEARKKREEVPLPEVKEEIPCCENNCPEFGILPSDDSCAGDEVCEIRGCTIHPMIKSWIEIHGCLYHPGARAYLNKDVIAELERRAVEYRNTAKRIECAHPSYMASGIEEAIALLRGDGK